MSESHGEENKKEENWSWQQNKTFEIALALIPENDEMRFEKIASHVWGKSPMEIVEHYQRLLDDLALIESGQVDLPNYSNDSKGGRSKGTPWTEEEQRLFLDGLKKYGKGDWKSIARNCVVTRTPSQVASHAQKYFKRQTSSSKERKRKSIHDITLLSPSQDMVTDNINQHSSNMWCQIDRSKSFTIVDSSNNSDESENESNNKNNNT